MVDSQFSYGQNGGPRAYEDPRESGNRGRLKRLQGAPRGAPLFHPSVPRLRSTFDSPSEWDNTTSHYV